MYRTFVVCYSFSLFVNVVNGKLFCLSSEQFQVHSTGNNLMPYYGLDKEIIVPSNKYKPVQRRTRRSESSNRTITSELESQFIRPKRDTSDKTGFKSALQRLGREVNLTSRLITWPPREVRPENHCLARIL